VQEPRDWSGADEGFTTLAELLVVMVLLGFVLAAAYGLQFAAKKAIDTNTPIATGASALGDPVEFMSRILMETRSVVTTGTVWINSNQSWFQGSQLPPGVPVAPSNYSIAVTTDRTPGDSWELNWFHIGGSATETLTWNGYSYDKNNQLQQTRQLQWNMSSSTNNITQGVPLFTYYVKGPSGALVATSSATAIGNGLRRIDVQLVVQNPDSRSWTKSVRTVTLRNY